MLETSPFCELFLKWSLHLYVAAENQVVLEGCAHQVSLSLSSHGQRELFCLQVPTVVGPGIECSASL